MSALEFLGIMRNGSLNLAGICESLMILCFGLSWPASLRRSVRSRSTNGKSLLFMCFVAFGYASGILGKVLGRNFNLAFWFYIPNLTMVAADICLWFRNKKIEAGCQ